MDHINRSVAPPTDTLEGAENPQLRSVPSGAFALAGATVGLLLVAWLFMYFFIFVPRGPVG